MPLPRPDSNQQRKDFVNECMDDTAMLNEFPNNKQRAAVCYSQYERATKSKASTWGEYMMENYSYDLIIF